MRALTGGEKAAAGIGIVLHVLVGVFPFAATGLVAPPWAMVVMYAFWVALLAVAVRMVRHRQRPALVPLVPAGALVGWFAFVSFGGAVLGWTA